MLDRTARPTRASRLSQTGVARTTDQSSRTRAAREGSFVANPRFAGLAAADVRRLPARASAGPAASSARGGRAIAPPPLHGPTWPAAETESRVTREPFANR